MDLGAIEGFPEAARARLAALCRGRLDADGRLMVWSQGMRDQAQNLEDALDKVRALVASALTEPRRRKKSRPPTAGRERRLETQKQRGALKRERTRRRQ